MAFFDAACSLWSCLLLSSDMRCTTTACRCCSAFSAAWCSSSDSFACLDRSMSRRELSSRISTCSTSTLCPFCLSSPRAASAASFASFSSRSIRCGIFSRASTLAWYSLSLPCHWPSRCCWTRCASWSRLVASSWATLHCQSSSASLSFWESAASSCCRSPCSRSRAFLLAVSASFSAASTCVFSLSTSAFRRRSASSCSDRVACSRSVCPSLASRSRASALLHSSIAASLWSCAAFSALAALSRSARTLSSSARKRSASAGGSAATAAALASAWPSCATAWACSRWAASHSPASLVPFRSSWSRRACSSRTLRRQPLSSSMCPRTSSVCFLRSESPCSSFSFRAWCRSDSLASSSCTLPRVRAAATSASACLRAWALRSAIWRSSACSRCWARRSCSCRSCMSSSSRCLNSPRCCCSCRSSSPTPRLSAARPCSRSRMRWE
mmetsp:Transcript_112615/g.242675  ORF Transcript_112615/g.242675 Transcript_112615/m.242675 type:complete len:442 (+) Transcript_112615:382-1707(+)